MMHDHSRSWRFLRFLLPRSFRERFGEDFRLAHAERAADRGQSSFVSLRCLILDVFLTGFDLRGAQLRSALALLPVAVRHATEWARQDVRFAARQLFRSPVSSGIAALSLAIGISVSVAAMAIMDANYFRALPIPRADQLVHIYKSNGSVKRERRYEQSDYRDIQTYAKSGAFSSVAGVQTERVMLSGDGIVTSERAFEAVSPSYFKTLEVSVYRGRDIASEDAREVVLSHSFWQTDLAGQRNVLGRTLRANGIDLTVVGIAPPGFNGIDRDARGIAGWVSAPVLGGAAGKDLMVIRGGATLKRGWTSFFDVVARMAPGVSVASANARLTGVAPTLVTSDGWVGEQTKPRVATVLSEHDSRIKPMGGEAFVAAAFVSLLILAVLAIACVNAAGLLLAKSVVREHEVAVRLTLGASRRRLFVQLFTESLMIAFAGAALGVTALAWMISAANHSPSIVAIGLEINLRLVFFAIGAALVAALMFGVTPILQSLRSDVREGLAGRHSVRATKLRGRVLSVQVAVSAVLLIVAFSALRGVQRHLHTDPGFDARGVVIGDVSMISFGKDSAKAREYFERVLETAKRSPAVRAIGITTFVPLNPTYYTSEQIMPNGEKAFAPIAAYVDDGYFDALGVPLVRGRLFNSADTAGRTKVAVINETYARSYRVGVGDRTEVLGDTAIIVGIAKDILYHRVGESNQCFIYYSRAQAPFVMHKEAFLVRTAPGMEQEVSDALRRALSAERRDILPPTFEPMSKYMRDAASGEQLISRAAMVVGGIELCLAAVGLYGVLLFCVLARKRELGVRLALGARTSEASWAILRQTLLAGLSGLGFGVLVGVPVAMLMASQWGAMTATDPVPYLAAIAAVSLAIIAASIVPLKRAAQIDPASALRFD